MNKKTIVIGSLVFLGISAGIYFYLKPKATTVTGNTSSGITSTGTNTGTIVNTLGSVSNNTYTATVNTVSGTPIVTNVTSAPVVSSSSSILNSDNSSQIQDPTKYNLAKSLANNVLSLSASAMLNVNNAIAYKKYEDAISVYISKINNLGYKLQDGVVVKI